MRRSLFSYYIMKLISKDFVQNIGTNADMFSILDGLKDRLDDDSHSFFILNLPDIVKKFVSWRTILPRIKPYYGINKNSSCIVLDILAKMGVGFECTQKANIVEVANMQSKNSILTSRLKTPKLLRLAASSQVPFVTFESDFELDMLKKWYPEANLVFHVKTMYDFDLYFLRGNDNQVQFRQLMKKADSLDLKVVGLHFDVEPEIGAQTYSKLIELARDLFDDAAHMGFQFNLLSLGSGFPQSSINEIAVDVNQALEKYFPDESVEIIGNAANYLVESAYFLACQIKYLREVEINELDRNSSKHYQYYINDGVFGSFQQFFSNKQNIHLRPLKGPYEPETFSSSIWGPTCQRMDVVVENVSLPKMLRGDYIVFDNMGVDSESGANFFPAQKVYVLTDDEVWLKVCEENQEPKELYFYMGQFTEQTKEEWKREHSWQSFSVPSELLQIINQHNEKNL